MLRPTVFAFVLAVCLTGGANAEILPLPSEGETFWGLGSTGLTCTAEPCVRHGIFSIQRDGTRGVPLSDVEQPQPPDLRANDLIRTRIESAYEEGRCVVAEGHFEGPVLVVRQLLGECLPR